MVESISGFMKKYWLRIVIVLLAVLFFLLAHRYFIKNLEKDGRPIDKQLEELKVTNPNDYRFNIEALSRYDERNYIYNLSGWAFSSDTANQMPDQIKTIIVLASNENEFYFDTVGIERLDVIEAFQNLNIKINKPGFSSLINQEVLPVDEYCIGVLLKNTSNLSYQLINTNTTLIRQGRTLELLLEDNTICESAFIDYVPYVENISLPETTDQMKYYIDLLSPIEKQIGSYRLIGWAFSATDQNQPTNMYKTYVILFNEKESFSYEVASTGREDVVEAFKDLNLNIINPGFQVDLTADQLPDDNYCIGILLSNDNMQDQFMVSNKQISKKGSTFELIEDDNACQSIYLENINSNSD